MYISENGFSAASAISLIKFSLVVTINIFVAAIEKLGSRRWELFIVNLIILETSLVTKNCLFSPFSSPFNSKVGN